MKTTSPMTYAMPVYQALASCVQARLNCIKSGNDEWNGIHSEKIKDIVYECMPSGSGIDNGTKLDFDASTGEKLVFIISYHHMNDGGMYDGWTDYQVIVTPSMIHKFNIKITGRDRNDIKEYLHEVYSAALSEVLEPSRVIRGQLRVWSAETIQAQTVKG